MGEMAQKISLGLLQTTTSFVLFYRVVFFDTFLSKPGLISSVALQGRFRSRLLHMPFVPQRFGQESCCITPSNVRSTAAETAKLMQDHVVFSICFPASANSAREQHKSCSPFPG